MLHIVSHISINLQICTNWWGVHVLFISIIWNLIRCVHSISYTFLCNWICTNRRVTKASYYVMSFYSQKPRRNLHQQYYHECCSVLWFFNEWGKCFLFLNIDIKFEKIIAFFKTLSTTMSSLYCSSHKFFLNCLKTFV